MWRVLTNYAILITWPNIIHYMRCLWKLLVSRKLPIFSAWTHKFWPGMRRKRGTWSYRQKILGNYNHSTRHSLRIRSPVSTVRFTLESAIAITDYKFLTGIVIVLILWNTNTHARTHSRKRNDGRKIVKKYTAATCCEFGALYLERL